MKINKKRRVLILFDDLIADMGSNKKLSPIVIEFLNSVFRLFLCHDLISKSLNY